MSDLICRKSMARCLTPGMCSPHGGCQPESIFDGQHLDLGKFIDHVWALKTERDQLKAELAGLRTGYEAYESVNKGLKAENETLVAAGQALRDEWRKDQADAERYRYLRDRCGLVEYKVIAGSIGPGMLPSGEKLDVAIDAAMGKGEQS